MLAALFMVFFLGGGAGAFSGIPTQAMLDDVDRRLQQTVTDPARAEQVAQDIAALREELERFEKTFAKSGKALTKIYEDHSAGAVTMQAELDTLDSEWQAARMRALDHRFAIRENTTREEWNSIFARQ